MEGEKLKKNLNGEKVRDASPQVRLSAAVRHAAPEFHKPSVLEIQEEGLSGVSVLSPRLEKTRENVGACGGGFTVCITVEET